MSHPITQSNLFIQKNLINGKWITGTKTLKVENPSTGEMIGTVPFMGYKETSQAIDAAHGAYLNWREKTVDERSLLIEAWHSLILEHQTELAQILTLEQGKVLQEATGEILYGASYLRWFAHEARRAYGNTIPAPAHDKRYHTSKQPVGVVGIITPWNFPVAMIARKVAPALAVGCSVVIKPSELTPFSALAMAYLAEKAGIPKGLINIVTGDASEIGRAMTESDKVRKFTFTGSTPIGKILYKNCADTIKKLSLELGGNAPFIVFDDANLKEAIAGAMQAKFRNSGQTCVCANRFIIHESIHDAFIQGIIEKVKKLKVGDGFKAENDLGPLINIDAVKKINRLVKDAIDHGATRTYGEISQDESQCFYQPVILTHIHPESEMNHSEIFGPVMATQTFKTEEEAISIANSTDFGLASYFYSENINRVIRVSEALEAGMVGVNTGLTSSAVSPFGGIKHSGLGREGASVGLEDYLELKSVCFGIINR